MAFHDVRLPDDVERGVVGGPQFDTTIATMLSGHEHRNINWEDVRGSWSAGYGIQTKEQFDVVKAFFYTRQGRAHGFRFKDWTDFEMVDQQIGLGDDARVAFQIFKRYSSGGIDYDRDLKKIVSGTEVVRLDGAIQTDPGDYSIDLNTGIVTMVVAPASTGGTGPGGEELLSVACEFDVPVRFDTDHFRISAVTFDAGSVPDLPLLEIRRD